jgi:myo-inositol 2-dehydrogenase/D-chiro-inositol 1-dehydrogenase
LTFANLHMGNALPTYSESGYGYAVEKAPTTKGWSYRVYEELWNYGFPQEMHHFAGCARGKETPIATGGTAGSSRKFSWPAIARPGWARRSA